MPLTSLPPMAQLRAFAAFAETRSMSSAGALLNVTHAAVSQQVRALEAHLGVRLLIRDGRGMALTDQGRRLGQCLRDAFDAMAREIDELTGAEAERPLQLTTTPMFAAGWLMPRIGDFRARHPEIDLMVNPSTGLANPEPGGFDLAIRYGDGDWPGLSVEMLLPTDFMIMGARSLIGDTEIRSPKDLLGFPWLQELATNEVRDWLRKHGVGEAGMRGLTRLPGNLLLDGLRRGQGIAAVSRSFVEAEIERGDLVVLFQDADPGTGYYIVTGPGRLRPPTRAFVAWLRRQMKAAGDRR